MNIKKKELLIRLCALLNRVAKVIVDFPKNPADCFCSPQSNGWSFSYDLRILEFVEDVINSKLDEIEGLK